MSHQLPSKKDVLASLTSIDGWLSANEATLLYQLAKKVRSEGEIVEIGSFKGKSTIAIGHGSIQSGLPGFIWAIDPHEGIIKGNKRQFSETLTDFKRNIKKSGLQDIVQPLVTTSLKASKTWKKPIRFLFLDGLHDYQHTHEDYQSWNSFVVDGGILAFHDAFCGEPGVKKVIEEDLFTNPRIVDIGTVTSILFVVIGRPTLISSLRVGFKKKIILLSHTMNDSHLPWLLKRCMIHIVFRTLLLTPYTLSVYNE